MMKFFGQSFSKGGILTRFVVPGLAALSTLAARQASAQQNPVLAWTPSSDPSTAGYFLYYGTSAEQFTSKLDVGTNTNFSVTNLQPGVTYYFAVSAYNATGLESALSSDVSTSVGLIPFLQGSENVASYVDQLTFPDGNSFGYYAFVGFPWIYHFDMGYEYLFDGGDAIGSVYMYDYSSRHFFYTNPQYFPYLYDFNLNSWLYYLPDPSRPGHYTTNPRYFYDFTTSSVISE